MHPGCAVRWTKKVRYFLNVFLAIIPRETSSFSVKLDYVISQKLVIRVVLVLFRPGLA
jgi:hypothetical protein